MSINSGASVALLTAVLAFGACSSSNGGTGAGGSGGSTGSAGTSGGGGTGGAAALPVIASCMAFCTAEKDCNDTSTVEDCFDYRCTNPTTMMPFPMQPESCRGAFKAYYDCLATQSMICDGNQANIPGACATQAGAIAGANCAGP